jgi:mono/diheme cytochrome c family protein
MFFLGAGRGFYVPFRLDARMAQRKQDVTASIGEVSYRRRTKEVSMRARSIAILAIAALVALPMFGDGAAIFKAKCTSCHGADGSGQTPVGKTMKLRDLRSADVQKQTDVELTKIISGGKGKMPPYGKQLSEADVAALIAHIRTLKAK